jgi:hypothetical protein
MNKFGFCMSREILYLILFVFMVCFRELFYFELICLSFLFLRWKWWVGVVIVNHNTCRLAVIWPTICGFQSLVKAHSLDVQSQPSLWNGCSGCDRICTNIYKTKMEITSILITADYVEKLRSIFDILKIIKQNFCKIMKSKSIYCTSKR